MVILLFTIVFPTLYESRILQKNIIFALQIWGSPRPYSAYITFPLWTVIYVQELLSSDPNKNVHPHVHTDCADKLTL